MYLTKGMKQDYINYNEHENEILDYFSKKTLTDFFAENQSLKLAPSLNPTNTSRLSKNLKRTNITGNFRIEPQIEFIDENNEIFSDLINDKSIEWYDYIPATDEYQKKYNSSHKVAKVSSDNFFDFIKKFKTDNQIDSMSLGAIKRHLDYIKNSIDYVWLVNIAPNYERKRALLFRGNSRSASK